MLTVGDTGRVDVVLRAAGLGWRPSFDLIEAVGDDRTARLAVSPMRGGTEQSAGYRVPTERRGVLPIGPLVAARTDVLGIGPLRSVFPVRGTFVVRDGRVAVWDDQFSMRQFLVGFFRRMPSRAG